MLQDDDQGNASDEERDGNAGSRDESEEEGEEEEDNNDENGEGDEDRDEDDDDGDRVSPTSQSCAIFQRDKNLSSFRPPSSFSTS